MKAKSYSISTDGSVVHNIEVPPENIKYETGPAPEEWKKEQEKKEKETKKSKKKQDDSSRDDL